MKTPSLIIITGMSGSGKTTALKTLEDLGCEVMDNIPLSLCHGLVLEKNPNAILAVGIDIRTRGFNPENFSSTVSALRQLIDVTVLFFDASLESLENRYRETRRLHPFGNRDTISALIAEEQSFLQPVKASADHYISTTHRSPPELKSNLQRRLNLINPMGTTVYVMSFAYRRGVPESADFVFDMRFLPNPYYNKSMKLLTGQSPDVQEFFHQCQEFQRFKSMLFPLLDHMLTGGRPSFVLAFGCSGGRHRSVCTAEKTAEYLGSKGFITRQYHRDMV
jgi:UPF0042 nucleotide-binding protein